MLNAVLSSSYSLVMTRLHHLVPVLLAATAHAGELTLEAKPFAVTHTFSATVLPETVVPIRLDAEAWTSFKIVDIADHGSSVKKGEPLLSFETEDIDRKIVDARQAIATGALELEQAKLDLATLARTAPEQMARLKRAAEIAAEEFAYFKQTRRKSSQESADQSLKRQEQILASYREELKQLLQMYEADDITEDTEEIILQKQHDSVEYAEFALRMEKLDHKRKLSIALPREETSLVEKRDDTALQLEKGSKDLPRSLELKKLEVATMATSMKRQQESIADLEGDRKLIEIKAPDNGFFYHGIIENGKWTTGDLVKLLKPGGAAPIGKSFATFFPTTTNLVTQSFLAQSDALALAVGSKGVATLAGRGGVLIPVAISSLSGSPNPDGTYSATLTAEWPESIKPVAGQALEVHMVSYSAEKAITVSSKAIDFGASGWTVEVKLADGKTERRAVTLGRSSAEVVEITAGLEAGQVVIVP